MTRWIVGSTLALLVTWPLAGQVPEAAARVVREGMDTKFLQPECKVEGGDFRVSSGKTYLKTGIETSDSEKRASAFRNGVRVLGDAIATGGQGKSSSAWYYLGRLYLHLGDVNGADTAFARAEALSPGCKAEIRKYRYRAWAALVRLGQTYQSGDQKDSALVMYRAANLVLRDLPSAMAGMAGIFSDAGQNDSAAAYFGLAGATEPTEADMIKLRDQSRFNQAVMLLNANRPAEAVAAFQSYLTAAPDDADALKGLAQALRRAGLSDSAAAVERRMVSGGAEGAGSVEGLSEGDLMGIGVRQFRDKQYREAASTFGRVLALNPLNQNALFNQANCYLALEDGPSLAAAAEKLLALEPLREFDHSMRIRGHKLAGRQDDLFKAVVEREATLVDLEMRDFAAAPDKASILGKATGREARTETNARIPAKALLIVFEFLAKGGSVVASQEISIPALKPGETADVRVEVKGNGIVGWRYRVKT